MLDIITAVKEKFNAQKYPVSGPTYILPDGSFLDIAGTFDPKNSFEDFPCHAEVEGFLLDIGLSNQVVDVSGSPTLESLGAIRCNDLADNNFVQLSNIRPTSDQYESLENWIYENATHRSELIVATPEFIQYKKYDPEDVEYIIKRIKRYYTSGTLYENMIENKSLDEAKKKKRRKKKQKALGWWQTFTPDAGNVLFNNAFFNHVMGNTTTDEFAAEAGEALADDCGAGLGESLQKETYFRVEVFNDGKHIGGLFRGLNDLINDLYEADDPYYDYLNDPLSELEYKTTFPKNFDNKDAIFAYKEDKYEELEETILDLQYALNEIGWDIKIKEISRPKNIVYEDDEQIAYILENINEKDKVTEDMENINWNKVQWGVHQFSTESIIFRGTEEECQRYIDDRPELWDDAEVYFMTPDDPHYIKSEEKQPLTEAGEEKVYQVIVKYKDEPAQKLEARTAKNRKELEYQLSTDPDVEWYDFDEKQFNEDKDEKQICCICGKEYVGYGNNAEPVKAGRCCDDCNINKVIPARLLKINVSESKPMIEIFQNLNKIKK